MFAAMIWMPRDLEPKRILKGLEFGVRLGLGFITYYPNSAESKGSRYGKLK